MAKKRIPEVPRDGSEVDFIPENFMLIDGAEGSAKMRMDLFGKASTIEELDETKYEKPEDGIPKADLAEDVQNSLGLADTALQASDIEGKANKSEMTVTAVSGDATKKTIQLKDGLSQDVLVAHQDISGKANKSEMTVTTVSGDATKKTIQLKEGLSQTVVVDHQDISGKQNSLPTSGTATDTYAINISGNAATATSAASAGKLTTSKTIGISGGATGTATAFDGSANINIPVTKLGFGTIGNENASDSIPLGYYSLTGPSSGNTGNPYVQWKNIECKAFSVDGTTYYGYKLAANSSVTITYGGSTATITNTTSSSRYVVVIEDVTYLGSASYFTGRNACAIIADDKPSYRSGIVDNISVGAGTAVVVDSPDISTATSSALLLAACAVANDEYSGVASVASGYKSVTSGTSSVASGFGSVASGIKSVASGTSSVASGAYSVASGAYSVASGDYSMASGTSAVASGTYSVASGFLAVASGVASVASGYQSVASGSGSVASGNGSVVSNFRSVASGIDSTASGYQSVASGNGSVASGYQAVALGIGSVASGRNSVASGQASNASHEGSHVDAYHGISGAKYQHVVGKWNAADNNSAFVLGWGTSDNNRKNIMSIGTDGDIYFKEGSVGLSAQLAGKANKSEMSVTDVSGDVTKKTIQLKDGLSQDVLTAHQDISGKANKVSSATSGNFAGLDGSGNLTDSGKKASDFEPAISTLPVSKGGTGATNAQDARTNLDVYSKDEADSLLNGQVVILTALPASGEAGKVYYIGTSGSGSGQYDEYIWDADSSEFIKVGERSVDLTGYWHSDPTTSGSGNVVTGITLGSNGVPAMTKGITALTEHQDISGKANKSEMSVTTVSGDATKKTIQLKDGLSQTVVVGHQDISGKANKSEMSVVAGTGANADKTTITLKTGTSATVLTTHQDIDGKVDKVTGKGLSTNDYTTTEKTKLSGIASGAEVNKIDTIKVNGTAQTITNKAVDIAVPTAGTGLTVSNNQWSVTNPFNPNGDYSSNTLKANSSVSSDYAAAASNYSANGSIDTALQGKAPKSHIDTQGIYGLAKEGYYGHVKIMKGNLSGTSYADGVAASNNHNHDGNYLKNPSSKTLQWGGTSVIGTYNGGNISLTMPANPCVSGEYDGLTAGYAKNATGTLGQTISNIDQTVSSHSTNIANLLDYADQGFNYWSWTLRPTNTGYIDPDTDGKRLDGWGQRNDTNKRTTGIANFLIHNQTATAGYVILRVRYKPSSQYAWVDFDSTLYVPAYADATFSQIMNLNAFEYDFWLFKNSSLPTCRVSVYESTLIYSNNQERNQQN